MPVYRRVNGRTWASMPWALLLFVLPIVLPLWVVWLLLMGTVRLSVAVLGRPVRSLNRNRSTQRRVGS